MAQMFLAGLLVCIPLLAAAGCRNEQSAVSVPSVTINSRTWRVELATTQEQRRMGLSGRRSIPQGTGMLFIFRQDRVLDFWMDKCFVPIDIAFIGPDKKVIQTYTMDVEPDLQGRQTYSSVDKAQYALEVPAGDLAAAGVRIGDTVIFSADIPDAAKAQGDP